MIDHLEGILVARDEEHFIVEVGPVGLRIETSRATREAYRGLHEPIKLFVHLQVRESDFALFGFSTSEERSLFEMLLDVSGIGPKVAISILSSTTPEHLREAIASGQADRFTGIKGVGKKTAQRLIVELKDRITQLPTAGRAPVGTGGPDDLALRALTRSLGFGEREAAHAIAQVREANGELPTSELIKRALEHLSHH